MNILIGACSQDWVFPTPLSFIPKQATTNESKHLIITFDRVEKNPFISISCKV